MEFSGQEYWSGLPCPPPGDLPHPGIKPMSLMSPALAVRFFTTSATWEACLSLLSSAQSLSHVQLLVTPWTAVHQASLSMGFSSQESWEGLPFPPPGDLPDPGIKPMSLMSPALAEGSLPLVPPGKPNPSSLFVEMDLSEIKTQDLAIVSLLLRPSLL